MTGIFKKLVLTTLFALFASQASALFIQADWFDPTQPGVGTNRYAYSGNDPVNNFDPNGNYYAEGANNDTHLGSDEMDQSDVEAFNECTSTHCFSGIIRDDQTVSTIDGPRNTTDNFAAHPGNLALQAAGVIAGEISVDTAMANVSSVYNPLNGGPSPTLGRAPSSLNNPTPGSEFYRGSRSGDTPDFTPRPTEFKVGPDGFVRPTHGVSVFNNPNSVTSRGFNANKVDQTSIPGSLQIIQRGRDPNHFEITPRPGFQLTPQQFIQACSSIRCSR